MVKTVGTMQPVYCILHKLCYSDTEYICRFGNCVLRGTKSASSYGITVTWRTDPVAETYLVYRRSSPSGVWTSLTSTAVDGQYLDTTVQPDTTYYYTVVGANGQYTSLSKDETTNTIPAPAATI